MTAALDVVGVQKRFGGLRVLEDVTFHVPAGSVTSVIGPNGSGKSTLLNIVTGVLDSDAGDVRIDGQSVTGMPIHERSALGVARTFQTARLFEEVSAVENVMVGAHARVTRSVVRALLTPRSIGRENRAVAIEAMECLALAGLPAARMHVQLGRLSMTDRRAVELARALMSRPRLLILDEPTGGLDPSRLDDWIAVLGDLRRELGITIVVVEHRMRLVMDISERVVVLYGGGVIAEGSPAEVVDDAEVRRIYLGDADAVH